MSLFDYFKSEEKTSASVAKERLQILVAHERNQRTAPDYLPVMQREIMAVVAKYVEIDLDDVQVHLDSQDNLSVLEVNVTLPN